MPKIDNKQTTSSTSLSISSPTPSSSSSSSSSLGNMFAIHKPELCFPSSTSPLSTPLPSLACQIDIPEPHPDYHFFLSSMRAQRTSQEKVTKEISTEAIKVQFDDHNSTSKNSSSKDVEMMNGVFDTSSKGKDCSNSLLQESPTHVSNFHHGNLQPSQKQNLSKPTQVSHFKPNSAKSSSLSTSSPPLPQKTTLQQTPSPPLSSSTTTIPTNPTKRSNYGLLSPQSLFEMSFTRQAKIYRTNRHTIVANKYATAADVRGYIPVYEYEVNRSTILMDLENSYILLTSICKALGPWRTDVVRQVESIPELESLCRKIRGGFLKIQGTWVPFKLAFEICKRLAWNIRQDLIPIFGFDFPEKCLNPLDVGYGELRILTNGRRNLARNNKNISTTQITDLTIAKNNSSINGTKIVDNEKGSSIALNQFNNSTKKSTSMEQTKLGGNSNNVQIVPNNLYSTKSKPTVTNTTNTTSSAPFTSRVILRQHPYAVRSKLAFLANRTVNGVQQRHSQHHSQQQDLAHNHQQQTAIVGRSSE